MTRVGFGIHTPRDHIGLRNQRRVRSRLATSRSDLAEIHDNSRDVVDNLIVHNQYFQNDCKYGASNIPLLRLSTLCKNERRFLGKPAKVTLQSTSICNCDYHAIIHTRSASPAQPFTISTTSSLLKNSQTPSDATTINLPTTFKIRCNHQKGNL